MHDLIFAVAFIAMVATPAMVATIGGRKEYNPGPDAPPLRPPVNAIKTRPVASAVRPVSLQKPAPEHHAVVAYSDSTLPMHNARGMANR
jgi:hypothetical protein